MSEQDKDAQQPAGKLTLRVDWHQLNVWLDSVLRRRPVQLGLVGVFVVFLAVLLGEPLMRGDPLASQLIVGNRAETNIKAKRDFLHTVSAAKLEDERLVAEQAVRPVFDHRAELATLLLGRLSQAFQTVTNRWQEYLKLRSTAQKQRLAAAALEAQRRAERRSRRGAAAEQEAGAGTGAPPKIASVPSMTEVKRSLRTVFSDTLQTNVPEPLFEELWESGFSGEVRASASALLGLAMNDLIISHHGALAAFGGQPLIVRHLIGDRPSARGEEEIKSVQRIKDLEQVRDAIQRNSHVHAAKLNPDLRSGVVALVRSLILPNLEFNAAETDRRKIEARMAIKERPIKFVKGQVIVRDGEPITEEHLAILSDMETGYHNIAVFQLAVGLVLLVLILLTVIHNFAAKQFRRLCRQPRDLVMMGVLLVGMMGLNQWALTVGDQIRGDLPVWIYALPVAAGAMLVRLLITPEAAALFAIVTAMLSGLIFDRSLLLAFFYMITGLVGAMELGNVQSRSTLLRAGLFAGLAGAGMVFGLQLFSGDLLTRVVLVSMLAAVAGGVISSLVTVALLPLLEKIFDYTTNLTLLELANLNHPLLRDLMLRAPGTYHHSMILGSLCETACDAIGANGLLARVACNYHDVGKMKNAAYFAENTKGADNPHNRLKPSMSALIIKSHIKDTIEMMREHAIPETVISVATQHHGTTLIEYFYHKAMEQKDEDEEVLEDDYRYPGPKPQSREAGVMMLADGVEAAARSLPEPTEDRLRAVVARIINAKFRDDQLAHTDLTLRDLHVIARSFLRVLGGIYHQRPSYPWQKEQQRAEERSDEPRRTGSMPKEQRKKKDTGKQEAVGKGTASHSAQKNQEGKKSGEQSGEKPAANGRKKTKDHRAKGKGGGSGQGLKGVDSKEHPTSSQGQGKQASAPANEDSENGGEEGAEDAASSADIKRLGLN